MTTKIQIGIDSVFERHGPVVDHPDVPERMQAVQVALEAFQNHLDYYSVDAAPRETIARIHHPVYIDSVAASAGHPGPLSFDLKDTFATADTYQAALYGVGASTAAVDAVFANAHPAFAFPRPPGHHAEVDRAMGFCFFNNIAIAAQYALDHHACRRVAIVDFDVHYGNGIQRAFAHRQDVLYISSHGLRMFPGSGHPRERGWGSGLGYTVNLPLGSKASDEEFCRVHQRITLPLLHCFEPDLILVAAGFDAHELDPVGGLRVTGSGYHRLARMLFSAADQLCDGRIALVLEGGFSLVGLEEGISSVFNAALEQPSGPETSFPVDSMVEMRLNRIATLLKDQWPSLV